VKAPSAGSILRRAGERKKLGVLALAAALLTASILLSASASASKSVVNWIGSPGSEGGQFSSPRGVAVNSTGAGGVAAGSTYVADTFNDRIQQFSPSGSFVRAWGYDVIQPGKPGDLGETAFEVCEVAADCKSGTSTSPAIGGMIRNPQGIAVDQATGAVYVTEQNFLRVEKFSASGAFQAAFGKDVVSGGSTATEVCTVASECQAGAAGEAGGEFTFGPTGNIAVAPPGSPDAGDLYVADPGNRRVQHFDSSGAFVAAFGADVENPSGGAAFEVCTVAANCRAGSEGSGNGQFAAESPQRVAVDDAGRIYAVDSGNGRVQRFSPAPAFDTIYGATQLSGSPAPTEIAIDPGAASAGDASDDHVFVVKPNNSPAEQRVKELGTAADPSLIDTHMSGAGIGSVNGLAVNTGSDRLFVSSETGGQRVYLLDTPLSAPTVTTDPVTTTTDTTATVTGNVNPEGGHVVCTLQYATSSDFSGATDVAVPDCETLSLAGGAQAVSGDATGLTPNTTYYVRLRVSRPFVSGSTVASSSQSFASDSVPPVVTEVGAVAVEDTAARLVGTIDPRNAETSYVFEYGSTPALGSSTAPLAVGGGTTPVVVSQVITGLAKDTTYFFRLTATNDFGPTPSPQASLHTRAEPFAPADHRAYEQVSPVYKNFGNAVPGTGSFMPATEYVALNGQAVVYGSQNAFANPPGQILKSMASYVSRRDADGWHTQPVFPNTCAADADNTDFFEFARQVERAAGISPNADYALIPQREYAGCATPPLDPTAPLPATNLYRANFDDDPVSYDLIVPSFDEAPPVQHVASLTGEYIGTSDDFSHIYYGTSAAVANSEAPYGDAFTKLWEWDNGVVRLASVDPSGTPFTGKMSMVTGVGGALQRMSDATNSVSADGSRFFFEAPMNPNNSGPNDIYMRESGVATYNVSESECTVSCGPDEPSQRRQRFRWASADGAVVTFETPAKLLNADTNDAGTNNYGPDLYAYRHSPNPTAESNLTLLSKDNEPADGTSSGFQEVIGMADDGSSVFFIASGQLLAGEPIAPGPKVYRWSWNGGAPTLQYLASAKNEGQHKLEEILSFERRVTRSGDALMMEATARIDPVADHDDDTDVYLWRLGKGWSCISCQTPGSPSSGPSTTGRTGPSVSGIAGTERSVARELVSAMSEDGSRVFFQTQDALVPTDTNGPCSLDTDVGYYTCTDIYEWNDGRISLVTTGTGSRDLGLIGVGESGDDVFFYSAEQLVGWDRDNLIDVYDARVGSGLPEPPPQPAACEGEACRGATSSAPGSSGAGTAVFQGPGNSANNTSKACPKGKRKVRRAGKTTCVKRHPARKHKRAANNNRRTAR